MTVTATDEIARLARRATHATVYAQRSIDGIEFDQRSSEAMHPDRAFEYLKAAKLEPGTLLTFRARYLDSDGVLLGEATLYES